MKNFDYLVDVGAKQLFQAIHKEHAQTIAIILAHIDANVAADVLKMFSNEERADIAMRMAQADSLPNMLVKNISDTLVGKIALNGTKLGGIKMVADILKHLDKR